MTAAPMHRPGRRATLLLLVLGILFVLVPFLFWWQTWFGRRLSDRELTRYLEEPVYGRKVQHALVQMSERMVAGDRSVQQWYPGLIRASRNPDPAVRNLAAWAMGQDTASPLLHDGLRSLLADPSVQVRRNAALSLVRFGDSAGHAELVDILRLDTGEDDVWEALRALSLAGEPADLPEIERYAHGVRGMPERIARQAQWTAQAIRSRPAPSSSR